MNKLSQIIALFLLFFSNHVISGHNFSFRHYTTEDGLSTNYVKLILQDHSGFIWICTDYGLNRFDGYNFKIFKNIPGDTTSLVSNEVSTIFESRDQTLWIGTYAGIDIYNSKMESFTHFSLKTDQGVGMKSTIMAIQEDSSGNIWVATEEQGVFVYSKNGKLRQYSLDNHKGLNSSNIRALCVDRKDRIWVSTNFTTNQLHLYDPKTDQFYPFNPKQSQTISNIRISKIMEDSMGQLWISTWSDGIFNLNTADGTYLNFLNAARPDGVRHIHSLNEYRPGTLLIGSDDGLCYFDVSTNHQIIIKRDVNDERSLSDNAVYPTYVDREGGLWIGTYYRGINYLSPNNGNFSRYTYSSSGNSMTGNIISSFCEDEKGNIWIGSADGGLSNFDLQTNRFTNYLPDPNRNSLSYHNIHALSFIDHALWIGTYTVGLNILDPQVKKFKHYTDSSPKRSNMQGMSSVYSIYQDRNKNIWIGTMSGINIYDRRADQFPRMKELNTITIDIIQDQNNLIWFATQGEGLFSYNLNTKKWKSYTFSEMDTTSINNNMINCLCIDDYQRLWIGTDDGLCWYDYESDSFHRSPISFPSSLINSIIVDHNILWITTGKGLIRYSPQENRYRLFTKADGLHSDQFTPRAAIKSTSGRIYAGTTSGFNVFSPANLIINNNVPPVVISSLQIFNKEVSVNEGNVLKQSITESEKIVLTHKQNVFSLSFAALSFCNPQSNRYQYRLENFDKQWNFVEDQRKATYTNLSPGHYTFRVLASNNDGIWNNEGAVLEMEILPPLLLNKTFILLYVIISIIILLVVMRFLNNRLKNKRNQLIERINQNKELELHNAKINFFTMIAHEIRTPVSLIIGPLEKITNHKELIPNKIQKELDIVNKNSKRLLTLINQLLDFRKAEQGLFNIHFSFCDIHEIIHETCEQFDSAIKQKKIKLELHYTAKDLKAIVDKEALTKILSNLIGNAIKFTTDQLILSCHHCEDQQFFEISVSDNGNGIPIAEQEKIFTPFYQVENQAEKSGTGIGLSLVKLLVEAHKGKISVNSNQAGTTFLLLFPTNQELQPERSSDTTGNMLYSRHNHQAEIISHSDYQPLPVHNRVMLVVEDHPEMREFICDNFLDRFKVILACDGEEGLSCLQEHDVSIIISDVMMPRMDGITFCKRVKEHINTCHIPLILLTAKTDMASKIEGVKIGADAYIEKPFSLEFLNAQVMNLLQSRDLLMHKFSDFPLMSLNSITENQIDNKFLTKFNELIEANFANSEFNIDEIAEKLNISRSGLFSKIKSITGMTPNNLIQILRLKKGAELLLTTDYRINEVAFIVGFNNPSYFSKCFFHQFKISPKEFVASKGRKLAE